MGKRHGGGFGGALLSALAGLLLASLPAYAQGQGGEPPGGQSPEPKKPAGAVVRTSYRPARVVTTGIRHRMGFRPPAGSGMRYYPPAPLIRPEPESQILMPPPKPESGKIVIRRLPGNEPRPDAAPDPVPPAPKVNARPKPKPPPWPPRVDRFVTLTPDVDTPAARALREARLAFRRADYAAAAAEYDLARRELPGEGALLFARAQALLAEGHDEQAARLTRKAVRVSPDLVRGLGDISGVYRSQGEFERLLGGLEERAAAVPSNADSKFMLAVQRYYTRDDRCIETFEWLVAVTPKDMVADLFLEGARERFKSPARVPASGEKEK